MAQITAVIGDARTIGGAVQADAIPRTDVQAFERLNPQLATARIRTIVAPHIVQDAVGGFISADFTIPAEEALRWKPQLRYGAVVWLFDGASPIFHGYAEQPVWTQYGDCQMTLVGAWALLAASRMREAWEVWDMSLLQKATGAAENKSGSVNMNSDGSLTLSFPAGSTLGINDKCSVEFVLFGEVTGPADQKRVTAFEVDVKDSAGLGVNFRFRVLGKTSPGTGGGDQLWDAAGAVGSTGIQDSLNLHSANQSGGNWVQHAGYRVIQVQLITLLARTPLAIDTYVTFDRVRFGTRAALFPTAGVGGVDTAAIARDVVAVKDSTASILGPANTLINPTDVPPEFWPSQNNAGSPDTNSSVYPYGTHPVTGTGTAPNSGIVTTGQNALEWQSPADILASLAAIDGSQVGFYIPYNARGGYDPPGQSSAANSSIPDVGSWWLTAPPQLVYQAFPDPNYAPDYTIQTRQGAVVDPAADKQPLVDLLYVNYQTNRGHQQSDVIADLDVRNYAYAQGFRRSDDYTLQTSGDQTQAASLAGQQLALRRQPYAAATITITNDGTARNPILKNGAAVAKLALVRPGSVRITDIPAASNIRSGYATHVEWFGETLTSAEYIQITLAQPGIYSRARAHGRIIHGYLRGGLTGRKLL